MAVGQALAGSRRMQVPSGPQVPQGLGVQQGLRTPEKMGRIVQSYSFQSAQNKTNEAIPSRQRRDQDRLSVFCFRACCSYSSMPIENMFTLSKKSVGR